MGWSEFETINRDASGGMGDILQGALMPLDLKGTCDTEKVGFIRSDEYDASDVCFGIKSDGFLDTFTGTVNSVLRDHSCKYKLNVSTLADLPES